MELIIGIGDITVSDEEKDTIKTFALASCIAVTAYSRLRKVGGMVHIALPSPTNGTKRTRPAYYATEAIPLLINEMCSSFGCTKGELTIQIFGGAKSINERDLFNIGERNINEVIRLISELNLRIYNAEVGGTVSRTVELELSTGKVKIWRQPISI